MKQNFLYSHLFVILIFLKKKVYVSPEHRRMGVAKALYSYCVKKATDAGCRALDFLVLKSNKRALEMYKSFGVTPINDGGWHFMRMNEDNMTKFMTNRYISDEDLKSDDSGTN